MSLYSFVDFLMVVLMECHSCLFNFFNYLLGFIDCGIVKIHVLKVTIDRNLINCKVAHSQKNHFYDQSLIAYKVWSKLGMVPLLKYLNTSFGYGTPCRCIMICQMFNIFLCIPWNIKILCLMILNEEIMHYIFAFLVCG
jgi:hypothetical protein